MTYARSAAVMIVAAGALALLVAVILYQQARVIAPPLDPAKTRARTVATPQDLGALDPARDIGAAGDVAVMAQLQASEAFDLGAFGTGYPLFGAMDGPKARQVRAVLVARDVAATEHWLGQERLGTGPRGGLFLLWGYRRTEQGLDAAIMDALSTRGLGAARDFIVLTPGPEFAAPVRYGVPPPTRLALPALLLSAGVVALFVGARRWPVSRAAIR